MRTFDDIMNDPRNHIKLKMAPGMREERVRCVNVTAGEMVTVKNHRVLHGRSELKGGISGRHLQCGYMDWDEIRSTIRVTRNKLAARSGPK